MNKNTLSTYINITSLVVLSVFLFIFPVYFLLPTVATEAFILPRQILTILVVSLLFILWAARSIAEKKIVLKSTPFNAPIIVFGVIIFLSSLLSRNMYDSLSSVIPVIAVLFLFAAIIQIVDTKKGFNIALSSFALGAVASVLISLLSYFKIYILPFTAIQTQFFNTFGSPVQQIVYLTPIFALALFMLFTHRNYRKIATDYSAMISAGVALVSLIGILFLTYQIMIAPQKPQILPISFGFQIATAAVSQDASRLLVSLPFGSGYGTFLTDFTRFKLPTFNANPAIWNLTFSYSSTFVLELLTTTGILGMLAYLYLLVRVLRTREHSLSPLFISLLVVFGMSFLIPFSFPLVLMLFVLLGFYASYLFISSDRRVYDIVLSLVALKRGLLSFDDETHRKKTEGYILPATFLIVILIVFGTVSYFALTLSIADYKIAQSFAQNRQANGQQVYNLQRDAIAIFPYRSDYYRIFSQLNLGLASSVSNNIPKGQKVNPETQQLVTQLLQQSIANSRAAITLSPISAVNWENLSQIYRNLINVGQNADQFAIASMQQAIALDPYNPLYRIELGGIYYQVGQYDRAQDQFQAAINLKPDLANAYYNLGHTYEAKGDLANALAAYETTMNYLTVQGDKDKLSEEIDTLKKKIASGTTGQNQATGTNKTSNQPPLGISTPSSPIPKQVNPVKISPPPSSELSAPTPTQ